MALSLVPSPAPEPAPPKLEKRPKIKITEDTFKAFDRDYMGICVGCRATKDGCEPDARRYECDNCSKKLVFGAPELLLMGLIEIIETPEEENIEW